MRLDTLRQQLLDLDRELIALYKKRLVIVAKIQKEKGAHTPIFCPEIEKAKKTKLLGKRPKEAILRFVEFLFSESRQFQLFLQKFL